MKRLLLGMMVIFLVTGCKCALFKSKSSPTRAVETFLGKYQALDNKVLDQLDEVIFDDKLTNNQKDDYKTLMRRQYQNLTYNIKDEVIDGNNAIVTVEIEVYDFNRVEDDIDKYVEEHKEEFEDEKGDFSEEKYMDYKLGKLTDEKNRIKYTLDLRLTKDEVDNEWKLENLTDVEKQKIHGVYKGS